MSTDPTAVKNQEAQSYLNSDDNPSDLGSNDASVKMAGDVVKIPGSSLYDIHKNTAPTAPTGYQPTGQVIKLKPSK